MKLTAPTLLCWGGAFLSVHRGGHNSCLAFAQVPVSQENLNATSSTSGSKQEDSVNQDDIRVPIYLSVDDKTRHWMYFGAQRTASVHKSDFGGAAVARDVVVQNGRGKDLKLDEASFELVDCPTSLSTEDFYSIQDGNADLLKKYHDEVSTFVKNKLGCDEVVCWHHQVRNQDKVAGTGGSVQGYAGGGPHTDSSPVSSDQLALTMTDKPEAYQRYLYLNLWRNIADYPIENDHLALLDERTTAKPDDYIPKDLFGPGYEVVQYGLNARHADNHKWYYFPQMHKDEGILFKQSDSDWTKQGRISFHMSVNDPKVKQHRSRESIELRMMCYWKTADSGIDSMPTKENTNADMIKSPLQYAEEMGTGGSWSSGPFAVVKNIFGYLFGSKGNSDAKYSGKPEDYLDKFVYVVNVFPYWPASAQSWAKGIMISNDTAEAGIKAITVETVNDSMNYQKTRSFQQSEKDEIVEFLMKSEEYMEAAKEHLGALLE